MQGVVTERVGGYTRLARGGGALAVEYVRAEGSQNKKKVASSIIHSTVLYSTVQYPGADTVLVLYSTVPQYCATMARYTRGISMLML